MKKSRKTMFPLIDVGVGNITYEHCLTERFYGDVFMGTAERNYYVDKYHEICLCVHYNKRVPGKYQFEPGYQFWVTADRKCLEIYWNLGHLLEEDSIIEKYESIEEAQQSKYYKDFCDLVKKIEEGIQWKKDHVSDPFEFGGYCHWWQTVNGEEITIYQFPNKERREFTQFHIGTEDEKLRRITVSKEDISDLSRFFKDFWELDKAELKILSEIDFDGDEPDECSLYYSDYQKMRKSIEHDKNTVYY